MPDIFRPEALKKYSATTNPNETSIPAQAKPEGIPNLMKAGLIGANLFDAGSTNRVISNGGRELNPAVAPISHNPALMYGVKGGVGLAEAYALNELSKHGHPKWAKGLGLAGMAIPTIAGIHNMGVK